MLAILRTILIALSLALLPLVSSFAGPYEDGIEAVERGEYEVALRIFRSLAEIGDARGQNGLGKMYYEGWGVPQDYSEAVKWYRLAADQNFASGQNNLGNMYLTGQGVPQDVVMAAELYRKAAEQGHPDAQLQLGILYAKGQGVQQNDAEAANLIGQAAKNNNPEAQHVYGYLHEIGVGVQQDLNEAASWYRKAAEQGNPYAQIRLGSMYEHGSGIPQDEEQAVELYRMAAEKGIPDAQVMLGIMYLDGRGVTKDESEAKKWFQKAAQQGHPIAQARLDSLKTGLPVIPTLDQALSVTAQDLAASYLSINEVVSMVALSLEHGINVTVNLGDGQYNITQENAASFHEAYLQRLDVYRKAIEQRGFIDIDGRYELSVNASCHEEKQLGIAQIFAVGERDGEPLFANELVIRQTGFKADLVFSADDNGQPSEIVFPGATVENAIIFSTPHGFNLWGTVENRIVNLQLRIEDVERALMMKFSSRSDRQAVADCVFSLTPPREGPRLPSSRPDFGSFADGQTAYEQGNYKVALEIIRAFAEQGHAPAQAILGSMYFDGKGVRKNRKTAVDWYRRAAEQGNPNSQLRLGQFYIFGKGVTRDYDEAERWFQKAAEHKSASHQKTRDAAHDHLSMLKTFRAAELGDASAQAEVGAIFAYGIFRDPQDISEAIKWYHLAAEQGHAGAMSELGTIYQDGIKAAWRGDYAPALQIFRSLADRGDPKGQTGLGKMYLKGWGVTQDFTEALKWYRKAAEQGCTEARADLAQIAKDHYDRGQAYRRKGDLAQAVANYTWAVEIDPKSARAYNNLAWLLATAPRSEIRDGKKSVELAKKAVALRPEHPPYMDTLAAAYAEAGEFTDAIRMQQRAIDLLKAQGKAVSDHEDRLKLYEQKKPFRLKPKADADQ